MATSKPEDQVTQLERDWLTADAKGDAASLRRIIADDFLGSSFDGGLLSKENIIPQGGGPGGFAGAIPSDTKVRVFGDTAVRSACGSHFIMRQGLLGSTGEKS